MEAIVSNLVQNTSRSIKNFSGSKSLESQQDSLKKAAEEFESMFYQLVFKSGRSTVFQSDLIKKDMGEEFFTEMFDTKMAEESAAKSVNGIKEMIYKQMEPYLESGKPGKNFQSTGKNIAAYKQNFPENSNYLLGKVA